MWTCYCNFFHVDYSYYYLQLGTQSLVCASRFRAPMRGMKIYSDASTAMVWSIWCHPRSVTYIFCAWLSVRDSASLGTYSCRGTKFETWPTMFWLRTSRENDWRLLCNENVTLLAAPNRKPIIHPHQNFALWVTSLNTSKITLLRNKIIHIWKPDSKHIVQMPFTLSPESPFNLGLWFNPIWNEM